MFAQLFIGFNPTDACGFFVTDHNFSLEVMILQLIFLLTEEDSASEISNLFFTYPQKMCPAAIICSIINQDEWDGYSNSHTRRHPEINSRSFPVLTITFDEIHFVIIYPVLLYFLSKLQSLDTCFQEFGILQDSLANSHFLSIFFKQ